MSEYYHLGKTHLAGTNLETFATIKDDTPAAMSISTDIKSTNLKKSHEELIEDDYEKRINYPSGYGYIASLPEVRNENSMEIVRQQQSILAISAITGVSLIVLGILISAQNNQ